MPTNTARSVRSSSQSIKLAPPPARRAAQGQTHATDMSFVDGTSSEGVVKRRVPMWVWDSLAGLALLALWAHRVQRSGDSNRGPRLRCIPRGSSTRYGERVPGGEKQEVLPTTSHVEPSRPWSCRRLPRAERATDPLASGFSQDSTSTARSVRSSSQSISNSAKIRLSG